MKSGYTLTKTQLPPADKLYATNASIAYNVLCNPAAIRELERLNSAAYQQLLEVLQSLRWLLEALGEGGE
jgi:hypothetical protein